MKSFFLFSISSKVLIIISSILIAKNFSENEYGIYSAILIILGILTIFSRFGTKDLLLYRLSKKSNNIIFYKNIYFFETFTYLLILPFLLMILITINYENILLFILLYIKVFFDEIVFNLHYTKLQAEKNFYTLKFISMFNPMFFFISIITSIYLNFSFEVFLIIYIIGSTIINYLIYQYLNINIKYQEVNIKYYYKTVYQSRYYFISNFMSYLYIKGDLIVITIILSYTDVAIYSIASMIIITLYTIPSILYNYYLPKLVSSTNTLFPNLLLKFFIVVLLIMLPISLGLLFFSDLLIYLLFGDKYTQSVPLIQLLSVVLFIHSISFVFAAGLTSLGLQKIRSNIQVFAAFSNLLLNFKFIPTYGIQSAVYTTLFIVIVVFILYGYHIMKQIFLIKGKNNEKKN